MPGQAGGSMQATVKAVCSISYVSEKLQVSRPSLYKYMELYDSGDRDRIPAKVLRFFDYLSQRPRTEDEAILYFIRDGGAPEDPAPSEEDGLRTECVTGGDGAMVMFPDAPDPSKVVVELLVDLHGARRVIGEYRPAPGRRFVRIDDLVPGHTFYYRVRSEDGPSLTGEIPFCVGEQPRNQ